MVEDGLVRYHRIVSLARECKDAVRVLRRQWKAGSGVVSHLQYSVVQWKL